MPEQEMNTQPSVEKEYHVRYRYRGRIGQVGIYLGKMLRMFVYQSDWKVLPMSALIGGVVGLVIRNMFFRTLDGTIRSAFCLACVAVWNGCFNSIQSICRERNVIKREHRSGMHISSYVFAHMLYQAILCLAQTILTMYILQMLKIAFPAEGVFAKWMIVDIGITMFLITYASDMMALLISSVVHSTTTAMTVMPFLLIFQLVFAGGVIPLPQWGNTISKYTITHYGLQCLAAQGDTNNRPFTMIWDALYGMRDKEVDIHLTVGQILEKLSNEDIDMVKEFRAIDLTEELDPVTLWKNLENSKNWEEFRNQEFTVSITLSELFDFLQNADYLEDFRNNQAGLVTVGDLLNLLASVADSPNLSGLKIEHTMTVGDLVDLVHPEELMAMVEEKIGGEQLTMGDVIDWIAARPEVQSKYDAELVRPLKIGDLINLVGKDKLKAYIVETTTASSRSDEYAMTMDNVGGCWFRFIGFALAFAILSVLILEFIDKDKR